MPQHLRREREDQQQRYPQQPQQPQLHGNDYFSVPGHTPVIFSEIGGRTLYRLLARDAGGETEAMLLIETVPNWVIETVVERKLPKFIKVGQSFIFNRV